MGERKQRAKQAAAQTRKARNAKDAETRKIVEERPSAVTDRIEHQAERRSTGGSERRLRRHPQQNRTIVFPIAATLLGIAILGGQTEPPDMTAFERQIAARQADEPPSGADGAPRAAVTGAPAPERRQTVSLGENDTAAESLPGARPWELDAHELAETERLLARLDLAPSRADGIIDHKTPAAIRLYQEIAGLPLNRDLL